MPVDIKMANRPIVPAALLSVFWAAVIVYSVFNGLMYGTRTALFMDVTVPRVAATQFTAYMALLNLVITYSANWQGVAVTRWGYPITLVIDSVAGLICLVFLPFMAPQKRPQEFGKEPATENEPFPGAAVPEAINPA